MSDETIVVLPVKKKDTSRCITVAHPYSGCQHKRAIVDQTLSELTCADCKAKLNPIQFLVMLAGQENMWEYQQKCIAKARAELEERKRCRCTKCGEWTEIRTVHNCEVARIRKR